MISLLRWFVFPILLLLTTSLFAENFTTLDGEHYSSVTIRKIEPDGLVVAYSDGVVKLKFRNLPPEIGAKYGYNPTIEANYLAARLSNDAAMFKAANILQGIPTASSASNIINSVSTNPANTATYSYQFLNIPVLRKATKFLHAQWTEIKSSFLNFTHSTFPWAFPTPTPTPVPAPTPISDSDEYDRFAKYIVIIRGDLGNGVEGRGTGFIVHYNNKIFLFTNIHVLDGSTNISCQTITGKKLDLGLLYLSKNYDLAAIELPNETEGIELLNNTDKPFTISDDIMILGNSNGDGVVTFIKGKISSIGPELIETDAKFVSGNSGSPLIDKKNHKAVGIATFSVLHKANNFGSDSKFNNTERRFAYRLDNISDWEQTTYPTFLNQSEYVKRVDARSDNLWSIANKFQNKNVTELLLKSPDNRVEHIIDKFCNEIHFLGSNSSKEDFLSAEDHLIRSLILACDDDMSCQIKLSAWHSKKLLEDREIRTLLHEYFLRIKKDIEINNVLY